MQKFFTNATLPAEIQQGNSSTFYIPVSLPTNIAPRYTDIDVKAETQLWNIQTERWFGSDHPTYQPTLYIESTTIVFAVATIFLFILNRRARFITQPAT